LSGTPAKIDDYVKDLMGQVKEGGGFVLAPGVNIPEEADPANVKALMDAVEKHGVY
jgi:uroporphyrinogen-III decarboxylase